MNFNPFDTASAAVETLAVAKSPAVADSISPGWLIRMRQRPVFIL